MAHPCLRCEIDAARRETDRLFSLVSDATLYERPIPERHRLIFYLGHLEAFDWNMTARALSQACLHPVFDTLFERGIDPEPGHLPSDQPSDWPRLEETRAYVRASREKIDALWGSIPSDVQQLLVEHRWMHAETFAYLLHNLPHELKQSDSRGSRAAYADVEHRTIGIPGGAATLGQPRGGRFGWDNEFDEVSVDVGEFAISKYKVTNGDYLAFVRAGAAAPFFWTLIDGEYFRRGMFEMEPLPLDAPVYVTLTQARSYAEWKGMRLPTESEFHRAAYGTPEGGERDFPWGSEAPQAAVHGNFDFVAWDPAPVTAFPGGDSAFGVSQLVGNGWEWTSTPFAPLPGFAPMKLYPGYSADFFDNQHFVIKGASPRTAALLTRRSLRNWFRPDYPYLYSTFRLVEP